MTRQANVHWFEGSFGAICDFKLRDRAQARARAERNEKSEYTHSKSPANILCLLSLITFITESSASAMLRQVKLSVVSPTVPNTTLTALSQSSLA